MRSRVAHVEMRRRDEVADVPLRSRDPPPVVAVGGSSWCEDHWRRLWSRSSNSVVGRREGEGVTSAVVSERPLIGNATDGGRRADVHAPSRSRLISTTSRSR